jgi:hypothetical protein
MHLSKPVSDYRLFNHCALLIENSVRLREKTEQLILRQKASLAEFMRLEVEMAHTFLDVARTTKSELTRERCLTKALRAREMAEQWIRGHAEERTELAELLAGLVTRQELRRFQTQ